MAYSSTPDFSHTLSSLYNPQAIEKKWQEYWQNNNCFISDQTSVNSPSLKPKYYVLEMLPYPSGTLHMGHLRNYAIGDAIARFQRANGKDIFHPMGWDAFGLPAENAAMQSKTHPYEWTMYNIAIMREQLKKIGFSYDWSKEITTCLPEYYKHEQKIFLDFLKQGLAYQKEATVNWDPVDNTVLANEQVIDGKGWRSGAKVEKKKLKQWFLKITNFADDLLRDLEQLEQWPEKIKLMQKNWIGKSQGALVKFDIANPELIILSAMDEKSKYETIEVFTTRPDTIFGASFIGISCEHPIVHKLPPSKALNNFLAQSNKTGVSELSLEKAEKIGFDSGLKIYHPLNSQIILPVYIMNYVLMDYGTGAIFGCPGHDERDHEFAKKYGLEIKQVVAAEPYNKLPESQIIAHPHKEYIYHKIDVQTAPFCEDGIAINSGFLDGLKTAEAKEKAITELVKIGKGQSQVQYRLHDWGISRQRYWGCPIPIIHCPYCEAVPVPENDLPVKLPTDINFDSPGNPLEHHPTWKYTICPKCGVNAVRETETFDTFFESSWYFARYCSPHLEHQAFDSKSTEYWLPVDQYIGGSEHAVMHLLYARFFTKALRQCGYWELSEPFKALLNQGMVCHATYKDSSNHWVDINEVELRNDKPFHKVTGALLEMAGVEKMSKSKKNGINPDHIVAKYGADAARMFILSDSPPEKDFEWNDSGIDGVYKYINRLYQLTHEAKQGAIKQTLSGSGLESISFNQELKRQVHKTIAGVTHDMIYNHFNKAIARIRELTNALLDSWKNIGSEQQRETLLMIARLMNPIAPHITEEIWAILHGEEFTPVIGPNTITSLIYTAWPTADRDLLQDEKINLPVQINGKVRGLVPVQSNASQEIALEAAMSIHNVVKVLGTREIKKVIYIPNKVINLIC